MLSVIMLNVIMLSIAMLSVVVPNLRSILQNNYVCHEWPKKLYSDCCPCQDWTPSLKFEGKTWSICVFCKKNVPAACRNRRRHVALFWRHDIHQNDTQHNDIQYNNTQHKGLICDTQHKWNSAQQHSVSSKIMLSVVMLYVIMLNVVAPLFFPKT